MKDVSFLKLINIGKLRDLGKSNPKFTRWLDMVIIDDFIHEPDDNRALFRISEKLLVYGRPCYFKYIVNPELHLSASGERIYRPLKNRIRGIVLRGLRNQYALRGIRGVQYLQKPVFFKNIDGLIGPLEYVEGYNLEDVEALNRNLPNLESKMYLISLYEQIIQNMHKKGYEHRDIKNENLLVGFNGPSKIIDFSTSCTFLEHEFDRRSGLILGTPGFFDENSEINCKIDRDFMGLGIVLKNILLRDDVILRSIHQMNGLDLKKYVSYSYLSLKQNFGDKVADYFKDLMNRPWPYDSKNYANHGILRDAINSPIIVNPNQNPGDTCYY